MINGRLLKEATFCCTWTYSGFSCGGLAISIWSDKTGKPLIIELVFGNDGGKIDTVEVGGPFEDTKEDTCIGVFTI